MQFQRTAQKGYFRQPDQHINQKVSAQLKEQNEP